MVEYRGGVPYLVRSHEFTDTMTEMDVNLLEPVSTKCLVVIEWSSSRR